MLHVFVFTKLFSSRKISVAQLNDVNLQVCKTICVIFHWPKLLQATSQFMHRHGLYYYKFVCRIIYVHPSVSCCKGTSDQPQQLRGSHLNFTCWSICNHDQNVHKSCLILPFESASSIDVSRFMLDPLTGSYKGLWLLDSIQVPVIKLTLQQGLCDYPLMNHHIWHVHITHQVLTCSIQTVIIMTSVTATIIVAMQPKWMLGIEVQIELLWLIVLLAIPYDVCKPSVCHNECTFLLLEVDIN